MAELARQFYCVPQESGNVFQRCFTFESLCIYVFLHFYYVCLYVCYNMVSVYNFFFTEICMFVAFFVVTSYILLIYKITKNDGTSQNPCFCTECYQWNTRFMLTAGFNLHTEEQSYKTHFQSIAFDKNDSFWYLTNSTITMNLDRLRKRVRHYIDQVRPGSIFSITTAAFICASNKI